MGPLFTLLSNPLPTPLLTRPLKSESVKCRFSKCRFSVLNLKFDFLSDGGCTREKQIQKALGSLPPCRNRCRFSESAICSSRVRPPSEIKSNFKFKTLRWRPLRWRLTLSDQKLFYRHFGVSDFGAPSSISGPRLLVTGYSSTQLHVHHPIALDGLVCAIMDGWGPRSRRWREILWRQ